MDPSEIEIIISQDLGGLNDGSFFIRNTETMQLFLDFFNDLLLIGFADEHHWSHWDQDPVGPRSVSSSDFSPSQAAQKGGPSGSWLPGDLVVHFPSCAYAYL
jgi:hypothetical protein